MAAETAEEAVAAEEAEADSTTHHHLIPLAHHRGQSQRHTLRHARRERRTTVRGAPASGPEPQLERLQATVLDTIWGRGMLGRPLRGVRNENESARGKGSAIGSAVRHGLAAVVVAVRLGVAEADPERAPALVRRQVVFATRVPGSEERQDVDVEAYLFIGDALLDLSMGKHRSISSHSVCTPMPVDYKPFGMTHSQVIAARSQSVPNRHI